MCFPRNFHGQAELKVPEDFSHTINLVGSDQISMTYQEFLDLSLDLDFIDMEQSFEEDRIDESDESEYEVVDEIVDEEYYEENEEHNELRTIPCRTCDFEGESLSEICLHWAMEHDMD